MFQRYFFTSCVCRANRFVRRSLKLGAEKENPSQLLWNEIQNKNIQSAQDWKSARAEILNNHKVFTLANIDALTVGVCTNKKKYDLAFSYLDFLKSENVNLNLATIGRYFKLLYARGVDLSLSKEDEEKILEMYKKLRESHPILDSFTLENVVQALSLTKQWSLCFKLLDEIKLAAVPTSSAYSAVAAAAFFHNSDELAWKVLDELLANSKVIQENVYTAYFSKIKKSEKIQKLEKMFTFMQKNSVRIEADIINDFVDSLVKLNLSVSSSSVGPRGTCKSCNSKLKAFDLTEAEFIDLKTNVIQNVIVGKDVYNKTSSEELKRFQDFTSTMGKFDVIIDGLNVAYSAGVVQSPVVTSGLLAAVVTHFINDGKKVLVLGRNHMSKWPKENWNYIRQNTTTFLTNDLSQDDPYLLYCALHSGKDTIVVTRDLMRSHKFLLNEVRLKLLFERWWNQRQYILLRVQGKGNPIFKKPLPFSHIAQKIDNHWHIPCTSNNAKPLTTTNWLCVEVQ